MVTDEPRGPWPDVAIPPGELLAETLEAMGLSQADLASRCGRPAQVINNIIKGKKVITPQTALEFERVLGTPAYVWVNLERDYQFNKARLKDLDRLKTQTKQVGEFPYAEMVRLGWVAEAGDKLQRVKELLAFFGVASLDKIPSVPDAAYRRSGGRRPSPSALAAWRRKAQIEAQAIDAGKFNKDGIEALIPRLRQLTREEVGGAFCEAKDVLRTNGVALVCVPHLRKTYLRGATWWFGAGRSLDRAVVALTARYRYHDIFWFSLFHEIGHLLRHRKRQVFIDFTDEEEDEQEREADRFAADSLIPPSDFQRLKALRPYRDHAIRAFAEQLGIGAGIVVGRLQHEKLIRHGSLNHLRRKLTLQAE